MKIAYSIADDPRSANEANNKGIPIVISAPRSKVGSSIRLLAKGLGMVDALRTASEATAREAPAGADARDPG